MLARTRTRVARTTRTNIALCFPELTADQQKELVRRSLCETGCAFFEMAAIWYWKPQALKRLVVQFEGQDLLNERLDIGGVICICPHWGNWEITLHAIATQYTATALYDARRLAKHTDRVTRMRSRFGLTMASVAASGLRVLLTALKSSQLVVVMPDQVPTRGNSVLVEFMGVKAVTTTMVHSLARHTNASVVLLTFQRVHNGFHIRAEPIAEQVTDEDPAVAAQAVNDEIARVILRDPAQYQWEYKRFRRVPDTDFYK